MEDQVTDLLEHLRVAPGKRVQLREFDPDFTGQFSAKHEAREELRRLTKRLSELQYLLYAEDRRSLLIVLQGMDAAGKDGTIRKVMRGLNPQGTHVTPFKKPSALELDHDYLWRIHQAVPRRGDIGIFNRSHYEDVLVVRVHNLVSRAIWSKRYDQINAFEHMLAENDVVILKFFLHISKDEQKKRFEDRLAEPERHWKISLSDFKERPHWDQYQEAYEEAVSRCSTELAPWFVIPANRKWFRNVAVATVIVQALENLDMRFPPPTVDVSTIRIE